MPNQETMSDDHDLLIELRTELKNIREDIKDLKDGTTKRIENLERDKANQKDVEALQKTVNEDIEKRVAILESSKTTYFVSMLIYTSVGVTMIGLILYHLFNS